ncbi:MAG: DUF4326 domain-containing protein [Gemmataceae bacterium]|nr:DUF4326 domain-containing protein [Gemmataceae bacterium]
MGRHRPTRVVRVNTVEAGEYVYVGRHSRGPYPNTIWGNPFRGADSLERYRAHVLSRPDLLGRLHLLRGQALGCWCEARDAGDPWPQVCHAQLLAELADGPLGDPPGSPPAAFGHGEPYRVVTVHQPSAWAIVNGLKSIENRPRPLHEPGPLLIHAGLDEGSLRNNGRTDCRTPFPWSEMWIGCIVGMVWHAGSAPGRWVRHSPFADPGSWCWLLGAPVAFASPIRCTGNQNIWHLPPELREAVQLRIRNSARGVMLPWRTT